LKIGDWRLKIVRLVLLGLTATAGLAVAAEAPKGLALPDVRAVVTERSKAVARVEIYEDYFMGLTRRCGRLLFPFPLHEKIGDALSLAFYIPSLILSPLRKGLGSGVLIGPEGHLLTNHHVVRNADRFTVYLTDAKDVRRKFDARVLGRDPHTDVAMLKIDPGKAPLVSAPLGDSDQLAPGDWIIVIGNPLNLTGSVSIGIVGGLHRQVEKVLTEDFIQLDATLNPGNSGGPVLNARGEVVGLVSLGFSLSNGIGFAIPTSLITPWVDELKKGKQPRRGYLGIAVRDVTPDLAKQEKLDVEEGVWVRQVELATPASRAGFEDGDVVTAVAGRPVAKAREFQMAVLRAKPGSTLEFTVRRNGKSLDLEAELGRRRTPFEIW